MYWESFWLKQKKILRKLQNSLFDKKVQGTEYTLYYSAGLSSEFAPPRPLPLLVPWGTHSLKGERVRGEPIRTKGQTLWYFRYSIIPPRYSMKFRLSVHIYVLKQLIYCITKMQSVTQKTILYGECGVTQYSVAYIQ
jgi:hypothetical protein